MARRRSSSAFAEPADVIDPDGDGEQVPPPPAVIDFTPPVFKCPGADCLGGTTSYFDPLLGRDRPLACPTHGMKFGWQNEAPAAESTVVRPLRFKVKGPTPRAGCDAATIERCSNCGALDHSVEREGKPAYDCTK